MSFEALPFSKADAETAVKFARTQYRFGIDCSFLLQTANQVLKRMNDEPRLEFLDVAREHLKSISIWREKNAYISAIGKMLSERSALSRRRVSV